VRAFRKRYGISPGRLRAVITGDLAEKAHPIP
jgi:hypothetical protein